MEIIAAWKQDVTEEQIVDYIRFGKLTCCVLIDRAVKVWNIPPHRRRDVAELGSLGGPRYAYINGNGYYRLEPADAVVAYYRAALGGGHAVTTGSFVDRVTEEDQRIILEPPFSVGWVRNWLARRRDLRITHEERERFAREHGIFDPATPAQAEEDSPLSRKSQIHRERCRAIAAALWDQDSKTTIAEMIKGRAITVHGCEGQTYTAGTLRDWIKDLAPNRAPGRRPSGER